MMTLIKSHRLFIILCLILFLYLGIKAFPENGWGGWYEGLGDAQSLLSIRHWAEDGFINSKFLAIPMGYSKITYLFDDPAMRHHARGTVTGGLIGNRLYYTHYPPGYLIPYALMAKFGVDTANRSYFRLLALIFSFSALILLYVFFNLISKNSLVSFFAVAYYALSTMFLDYADSLANQPIDDLLRAAILVLSILALQLSSKQSIHSNLKSKIYNLSIWFLYLILSLSSYDSTFFVFIWLVGLDVVMAWRLANGKAEPPTKKLLTIFSVGGKKWIFFASAPILAFVLQMLQNYWYLGNWYEVWLDVFGASMAKAQTSNIFLHIKDVFYTWSLASGFNIFWSIILIIGLFFILRQINWKNINKAFIFQIMMLLFLGGAIYPFIFVGSGGFSYQGRQMMPMVALLIGMATASVFKFFKDREKNYILLFGILIAIIFLWSGQIYRTVQYIYNWPNNQADSQIIQLSKSLKPLINNENVIMFYLTDGPIFGSVGEYYLNMPVLYFKNAENLIEDFLWIENHSQYTFKSIIVTDKKSEAEKIRAKMNKGSEIFLFNGKYIFNI